MTFSRRHVLLLWAIAAWNLISYANFAQNLLEARSAGEDRPTGYWVAHTVLIVVNVLIAVVLARLGWRAHKSLGRKAGGTDDRVLDPR